MSTKKSSLIKIFADKFSFPDEEKLISTLKATAFKVKDGSVTDEQLYALLIVAEQYDLNPFTKEIFAFPDKQNGIIPVVSVDGWSRIINSNSDMDGLEFVYDEEVVTPEGGKSCSASIECVIYRKGRTYPVRVKEFLDEVYRPPFNGTDKSGRPYTLNGPWQTHTKRMLRHKALIQCSRIAFGFVGIYDQDEAERIIEGEVISENGVEPVGQPSIDAVRMAQKLVERARNAGAWQAALDYAGENFSGFNLVYIKDELNKAQASHESATLPDLSQLANDTSSAAQVSNDDPTAPAPVNGKKSPLSEAKNALV